MIRFRDVLKDRNFLFLWLGQLISNFGDRLNQMALVALVYQRDPGSEVALAKLISFTIIPVFVIGPIAGVWVDRLNRKYIMVISDILRGFLVLLIPLFIVWNRMLPIYLVIFLVFSISRFFIPSKMAIIPDLVTRDKLLIANTLQDMTHMIGNIVGLMIAGFIVNIRYIGAVGGFYIDSATFFVSAALIGMIVHSTGSGINVENELVAASQALKNSLRKSFYSEIKDGIRYITSHPGMRFIVQVFFVLLAGIGAISCVIIVFIQEAFGTSTRHIGFLATYLVGGLFAGTIIYGRLGQKLDKPSVINLSFVASGFFIIAFTVLLGGYPNVYTAGLLSALIGLAVSPMMVSLNTIVHETIPEEVRGRIFSSLEVVIHLSFLVFMFLAAYAAKFVGRFWVLMAVGAAFSLCGITAMLSGKKTFVTSS
ncbi:MAG: MFS transporter [Candidatus Omnitrophica bacterium]|nr:MFS transporter [Candidatus Omnitrophota bacterium]MCM8791228.1 MFS transporter [Candidatus Omnitrophota bacterium]